MLSISTLWFLTAIVSCYGATVQIYPDVESMILAAGGQLTLSCRSTEEVTWIHKDFAALEDIDPPLTDQYEEGPEHVSNLTIRHLSYKHVGSYNCQSTTHNSSIYIYVIDKAHLLVDEEISTIFAPANSDVVIPCKPTQPGINVTLTSPDREKVILGASKLTPPNVPYDPQVGFTLRNVTIENVGDYQCKVATSPDFPSSPTTEKHLTFVLEVVDDIELPEPQITPLEDIMVGETLNISCSVEFPQDAKYQSLAWEYPAKKRKKKDPRVQEILTEVNEAELYMMKVVTDLVIRNVTYSDTGEYTCVLRGALQGTKEETSETIQVLGLNQSYLELTAVGEMEYLRPESFREVKFIAEWNGSPEPKLSWFTPRGKEILPGGSDEDKYKLEVVKSKLKLYVRRLEPSDAGVYLLKAHNEGHERALNFSLLVESGPQVGLVPMGTYYMADKTYALHCTARGYPLPDVTWLFQKCDQYPKCDIDFTEVRRDQYMEFTLAQGVSNEIKSKYNWTAETTGILMCRACNKVSFLNKYLCENSTVELLVTDLKDGYSMEGPSEVFEGDEVSLSCGVNKYHFASNVSLVYEKPGGQRLEVVSNTKEGIFVSKVPTRYSNKVELKLSQARVSHSGAYKCEASRLDQAGQPVETAAKTYTMNVQALATPRFLVGNTLNGTILRPITGNRVELKCFAQGTPKPKIYWFKDDHPIQLNTNDSRLQLLQDDQILNIQYGALTDEGRYKCVAMSRVGVISASMAVAFRDKSVTIHERKDFKIFIALIIILVVLCLIFYYKIRTTSTQYKRKLESLGLKNFEKGQTDALNPEFDVSQQAELLPYDKKWEFPRAKLKLGHQLGSGAFGVVMKAEADGIVQQGETTTVAVKMVKKNNVDLKYLKALSSELKIMAHLGKHLNIVNLLGACTDNLDKRELLVIVEYCKYGNLHNLLLKHRDVFINQVDSLGNLDPSIKTLKPRYVNVPTRLNMSNSTSAATGGRSYISTRTTYTGLSDTSETGLIGPDGYLVPNEKEPAWRVNYSGDRTSLESICTQDLICWAFQVARGMEYLASRKVMHGDLAARNILLADDNIVKICDFGLAKAMFTDANYLKTGDEPLPIKWMAIESIRDKIFSTQSDVWAFAVTLWELFSLARTPYPGIEGVENLYLKLAEGHRMEKPEFCTDDMYLVMLDCWQAKPVMRPNFTELVERVGSMVDDNVRKHYLNLNEVYLRLNDEALGQGQDYLAMLSSPDIQNQMAVDAEEGDDGYLRPNDLRDDASMELKPMLPQLASKASSFSNPSYLELSNNNHHIHSDSSYNMPRVSRLNSVDDYDPLPNSKQEATRALKLNWLFPPDLKTHTTFV